MSDVSPGDVRDTAKQQARRVGVEAKAQARTVAADVRNRVTDQAHTQNDRLVGNIRQTADHLDEMRGTRQDGPAATVVARVADGGRQIADYLERNGPEGVLREVQDFARRRPGAFLATALAAGFVVGRLGKGVAKAETGGKPASDSFVSGAGYPAGGAVSGDYPAGGAVSGDYPAGGAVSGGGYPAGGAVSGDYPAGGAVSGDYPAGGAVSRDYPAGVSAESAASGYPADDVGYAAGRADYQAGTADSAGYADGVDEPRMTAGAAGSSTEYVATGTGRPVPVEEEHTLRNQEDRP